MEERDSPHFPVESRESALRVAALGAFGPPSEEGGYWVVTDPKVDGYDVTVAWRTWPATATEAEMRAELKTINLGFRLNAPARVAMSKIETGQ